MMRWIKALCATCGIDIKILADMCSKHQLVGGNPCVRHRLFFCVSALLASSTGSVCAEAQTAITESVVLQICKALSNKAPEQMPNAVMPASRRNFVSKYARFRELEGCISAKPLSFMGFPDPSSNRYLVQHTRFESRWRFRTEGNLISEIFIDEFKPVTLADDEPWTDTYPKKSGSNTVTTGAAPPPDSSIDRNIVEFFYTTNRKESDARLVVEGNPKPTSYSNGSPIFSSNGWIAVGGYTGDRATDLSFGAIRIRVPEGHRIGRIELPKDWKLFGFTLLTVDYDAREHFIIRSIEKTDEKSWVKALSSFEDKRKALIFVHGFNTKFRDAALRTAQIVWDLQFHGTAVLFSWPSRGEIADYLYDQQSALASRGALLRVIENLRRAGFENIDIIAHSMGNLIAVDALANSASTSSPVSVAQLIMAAPDVDRDMFLQAIPGVLKVTKGLTLYANKNDKALQLSMRIAGNVPRAGDVPNSGPLTLSGLWTIDASQIGDEMFGLNHNTFATTRNILNDLKILIDTGAPPPRLGEIRAYPEPPQTPTHFRYVP